MLSVTMYIEKILVGCVKRIPPVKNIGHPMSNIMLAGRFKKQTVREIEVGKMITMMI